MARESGTAREVGDKDAEGDTCRGAEEGGAVEEPTREVGESGLRAGAAESARAVGEPTAEIEDGAIEGGKVSTPTNGVAIWDENGDSRTTEGEKAGAGGEGATALLPASDVSENHADADDGC